MSEPKQLDLFPYRESRADVIDELSERLPITDHNELVAALGLYHNTVLHERQQETNHV